MKTSHILFLFVGFATEYSSAYHAIPPQQQDFTIASAVAYESGREIYVVAHRSNTIKWLDYALKWSVNGIEVDVTKGKDGELYTWHGESYSDWEHLGTYLDHACSKLIKGDGKKVALMIFDLKYSAKGKIWADDITKIREMVWEKLLEPLNRGMAPSDKSGFYVFYGVSEGARYAGEFEKSIAAMDLKPREGVNYDAYLKTYPDVALKWKEKVGIKAFLYSAGFFSGFSLPHICMKQLEAAVKLRKSKAFGVYGWTFDHAGSAANAIRDTGCDGVLGNMNEKFAWLPQHLSYYGLQNYQLADRNGVPPFLKLRN